LTTKFIPNSEKVDILTKLPCFMSSTVFSEVIALLVEHKMFNKIYALFEGYAKVVNKKLNRIIVQVFSAVPLPDPLLKDMKDRLEFIVKKDVRLKLFVQPALVGGVMLKFPNGQIYDFSINKMLSNFKYHLMERN